MTAPDFSHQKLRGRDFRGQNLCGARFTGADLRGARFQKADLTGADFSGARLGKTVWGRVVSIFLSILIGLLAGALEGIGGVFLVSSMVDSGLSYGGKEVIGLTISSAVGITVILLFFLRRNGFVGLFTAIGIIIGLAFIVAEAGLLVAVVLSETIAGVGVGAVAGAVAIVTAGSGVGVVIIAGAVAGVMTAAFASPITNFGVTAVGGAVFIFVLLSFYIVWRIRREDPQFTEVRQFGLWLSSPGGTNFHGANLTDTQFQEANLKHARFNGIQAMTRANFQDATQIKFAYAKNTLLEDPKVRNLLVSGEGSGQSYAGLNLTGAFLVGARLSQANLTEMNLSDAELTNADLSEAKLIKTQLIGADLTNSHFTGACIESWNIDKTTRLQDIDCEYVFLEADNPKSRQPPSGTFAPGEFSRLFQEVAETMDFIVENRLELDALLQAIQKLREAGNEGLEVRGVERKGDAAVVHVAAPPEMDRERIHSEIELLKERLSGKDERIGDLKENVIRLEHLLAERGNTYIEKVEGNAMTHSQTITDSTIVGSTLNQGAIHGRLTNLAQNIGALPATGDTTEAGTDKELAALLTQLAEMLKDVPSGQAENAEAVATMVERAVEDARTGKRSLLKDTGESLKKYAQPLSEYSPSVLQCVTEIMKLLGG
uniref:Pentapeptide repeat-containing protein n=1 Tax=Candidatus Kentrum sp. FW TaxID=2126338 RepID=A0A450TWF0_9GAMM|nr:MAG: Pentapeptide repeat-containing protein [Candidatus Kentron sp. FW]